MSNQSEESFQLKNQSVGFFIVWPVENSKNVELVFEKFEKVGEDDTKNDQPKNKRAKLDEEKEEKEKKEKEKKEKEEEKEEKKEKKEKKEEEKEEEKEKEEKEKEKEEEEEKLGIVEYDTIDICDPSIEWRAHVTYTTSERSDSKGLAAIIAKTFNDNYYEMKKADPKMYEHPGKIFITKTGVVNMNAIFNPGKPRLDANDDVKAREGYLKSCLQELGEYMKKEGIKTIAMPWFMNCDLAGGDWSDTLKLITKFANEHNVYVLLCSLKPIRREQLIYYDVKERDK